MDPFCLCVQVLSGCGMAHAAQLGNAQPAPDMQLIQPLQHAVLLAADATAGSLSHLLHSHSRRRVHQPASTVRFKASTCKMMPCRPPTSTP